MLVSEVWVSLSAKRSKTAQGRQPGGIAPKSQKWGSQEIFEVHPGRRASREGGGGGRSQTSPDGCPYQVSEGARLPEDGHPLKDSEGSLPKGPGASWWTLRRSSRLRIPHWGFNSGNLAVLAAG